VPRESAAQHREGNFAAEECFERLAGLLGTRHTDELESMRASIDNLDYAAALEPLANIAAALELES
jgi:hypothetical protein